MQRTRGGSGLHTGAWHACMHEASTAVVGQASHGRVEVQSSGGERRRLKMPCPGPHSLVRRPGGTPCAGKDEWPSGTFYQNGAKQSMFPQSDAAVQDDLDRGYKLKETEYT